MLPLVQAHPMVQPPLDFLSSHEGHLKPNYSSHQHGPQLLQPSLFLHGTESTPRAFAMRSAQHPPALHRITASFTRLHAHDQAEHSLRRKTPSGTIDNGYDGSSTHLASGPPALKHMIVPASSKIFPTAVAHRASNRSAGGVLQQTPAGPWVYSAPTPQRRFDMADGTGGLLGTPGGWETGMPTATLDPVAGDGANFVQPAPPHNYRGGPSLQPVFVPGLQQPLSQTIYSPGSYQQPPVWRDGSLGYQTLIPLANNFTPQTSVDSAFMGPESAIHPGLVNAPGLGQAHHFGLPLPGRPVDDGFARYGHNYVVQHAAHPLRNSMPTTPGVGHMTRPVPANEASSPTRFKERALQNAHKAYNDLLLHLTAAKKAYQGRSSSSSRPSSKMMVYPKPSTTTTGSGIKARPLYALDSTASYAQQLAQKEAAARAFAHDHHQRPYHEIGSPVLNARASLEMLSTLCEQSGWKWSEGMLLGGCLYYGLERYEEALEWFKRIVSLDPSHVEAISNIAATLYCLNRHEEAEQHWVKAIKLRPSFLEAVEHLVSLLCSLHRNAAAVNAIEFIQRSLKIQRPDEPREQASETASEADISSPMTAAESDPDLYVLDSETTDSPEQRFASTAEDTKAPGFGSSGYRIPGSENGRMILLIHAKGNMLYSLKDTDRASEAFEEVVTISAGKHIHGVKALIRRIQTVLAPRDPRSGQRLGSVQRSLSEPLLLPPDKAKLTAQFVFGSTGGQLPGLQHLPEGAHRKSVVATTSNSLLSLAKIYQDAMSNGGSNSALVRQPAGVGDILALYYLSLSLQESPSTANNVGILLAGVQQTAPVQYISVSDMGLAASVPGIVPGSGLSLALAYYQYGLTLDPKHVHLHTNLGSLLKDIGQLDMAISMYEQAVACDGTFDIALTNLANAVKDRGRVSDAIKYYQRAVASNPDFAEAVCGLSTALNSVCDWRGRGGVLLAGGRYDRWHVDENGKLQDVKSQGQGSGLMKRVVDIVRRQLRESLSWGCGLLQEQSILQLAAQLRDAAVDITDASLDLEAELRKWAGRPGEGYRILRLIERSTITAMRSWYQDKHIKRIRSPASYRRPKPPASLSVPSAPTVLPFHTFTCPLPAKDVRMISQRNALRISFTTLRSPWIPATVYEPPDPPSPHLNVGYVSSDFNNHPLAHLMQSVFGMHNPKRVKAFCYATTASDRSIHRQQIEREAPVFRDVSTWSADRLVDQIVKDKIHILVNLNGYTRGARNEIFAARPAPIQMSFMGFAGTLGAEWCDYLLADATAIPRSTLRPHRRNLTLEDVFRDEADADAEDWIYSENIIFCRDTFFCCDHAQSADGHNEKDITWEEDQRRRWRMRKELFPSLPDDAILLGNFNQLYKIDPTTFRSWLRILAAAPRAYLWLLRFPELGETHLRRTARDWGGEGVAKRIIFTDVAPKLQHISRARVCDLFLDTPECNAHTTAADILWSNTPLLTLPRYEYKMCSRMAASILKGALPKSAEGEQAARELIARDEAEYEEFAVHLTNGLAYRSSRDGEYREGVGRLAELRKLLFESKWTCALFDTRRWVRDLEEAYEVAWARWERGEGGDIYL
ncbi:glycosyltransferase family 41 protein [Parathielavia appendiculata]|uniref:protein O-GlcNAc transferase n=1 Tax=Parathielavia appendiculata TaxID=2587402 RepID=A0AAN6U7I7_9PEZI|nr:glycosyltransferase family 41 protein [Parathielavia appendiculata]